MINPLPFKQLKENWNWYFMLGLGLTILGALAIVFSVVSTEISIVYLGGLLVIAGLFEGAKALKMTSWGSFFLHLLLCPLYIFCGIYLIINPLINAVTLTLFLAIFFIISGIARIIFAILQNIPHKGWLIFNGACTLILGILIWQQWPISGIWVIGTLVGIDLLFTGATWIALSLKAKNLEIR